jgi:hypothetical protein
MHQVDPKFAAGGQEQRHDHQDDRGGIEHAAKQQDQQDVDTDQEGERRNIEPTSACATMLGMFSDATT